MSTPQTTDPPVAQGTVLAGKYRVERVIGEGGMGVVVEAKHIALDERVAMKFLTAAYATHPEASARFLREARAAVKIKSEHVARVSDVGTLENGAPYMVMELLQGNDLNQELQKKGVLPLPDAVDYLIQACEAIAEAHGAGIVHRDIKPANLFLARRLDGSALVKVLDFGISKMSDGVENLTKTMAAMGSALYMSPEQMQQTRGVDHRTDIYALGVALYELLAGKQPYYADTLPQLCAEVLTGTPTPLRTVRPDLPPDLAPVIEKAYARDRAERYQSVAHFVVALAPFAPTRSQPNIDRIARVAGLPVPIAGTPAPRAIPGGDMPLTGGTIALDAPSPGGPPARGRSGTLALESQTGPSWQQGALQGAPQHASGPGYGGGPQQATGPGYGPAPGHGPGQPQATGPQYSTGSGPQQLPGPQYSTGSGPQPFQQGASAPPPPMGTAATAPNMELATNARPAASSKAPIFIGLAIALIGAGVGGFFALRPTATPEGQPTSAGAAPPGSSAATTTAAPAEPTVSASTSAAAAPAEPTVAASTSATAAPKAAEPTPSTKVAVAPPPGKPVATAAASAKPTASTKPKSIFDDR